MTQRIMDLSFVFHTLRTITPLPALYIDCTNTYPPQFHTEVEMILFYIVCLFLLDVVFLCKYVLPTLCLVCVCVCVRLCACTIATDWCLSSPVPTASPQDVAVEVLNTTLLRVSWTRVAQATLRGHLGGYNVSVQGCVHQVPNGRKWTEIGRNQLVRFPLYGLMSIFQVSLSGFYLRWAHLPSSVALLHPKQGHYISLNINTGSPVHIPGQPTPQAVFLFEKC